MWVSLLRFIPVKIPVNRFLGVLNPAVGEDFVITDSKVIQQPVYSDMNIKIEEENQKLSEEIESANAKLYPWPIRGFILKKLESACNM